MQALRQWWSSRVPISGEQLRTLTNEPVPNHMKRWWFCLGGTPAYLFIIQIVTGILLAVYYQPTAESAYQSIGYITDEVTFGWYFRSMHKWAATLMIAAVILHQIRVYFTASYRAPRELNWVIGMLLLFCTLGLGFSGYSLVFEQLSYWGATVGANLCRVVPFVGDTLANLMLGGEEIGSRTLSRLYVLHAAVLPACVIGLVAIHFMLMRLHGITELRFEDEPKESPKHFNFFPDHVYTELIVGLSLMIVLSALAVIRPADMGPKANPLDMPPVIKPEWFFFATFRWLKLSSAAIAVFTMTLVGISMIGWPWIDAALRRWTKREEISVWIGVIVTTAIIGLTIWEAVVLH